MDHIGALLGKGCYSKVYEHATNENRVFMVGTYSNDLGKLALYASIGYLYSLETHNDNTYTAELERMIDQDSARYSDQEIIKKHVSLGERIRDTYRDPEDWYTVDYTAILWEYATNPNFSPKVTQMCAFLISCGVNDYHHDNHTGNWLIDKSGDCLPMDVFNLGYYLSDESTSKMKQLLKESTT